MASTNSTTYLKGSISEMMKPDRVLSILLDLICNIKLDQSSNMQGALTKATAFNYGVIPCQLNTPILPHNFRFSNNLYLY